MSSPFQLIHRDEWFVVVDKVAGLPIHKNDRMRRDHPYLTKEVGLAFDEQVYPVHRLDAKTSGVVVLAFDRGTAEKLAAQFRNREVEKHYLALVKGLPGEGAYIHQLWDRKRKKKLEARLTFTTIQSAETRIRYPEDAPLHISLVDITLETGRWHQIDELTHLWIIGHRITEGQ